jgi:hypothetical protein
MIFSTAALPQERQETLSLRPSMRNSEMAPHSSHLNSYIGILVNSDLAVLQVAGL